LFIATISLAPTIPTICCNSADRPTLIYKSWLHIFPHWPIMVSNPIQPSSTAGRVEPKAALRTQANTSISFQPSMHPTPAPPVTTTGADSRSTPSGSVRTTSRVFTRCVTPSGVRSDIVVTAEYSPREPEIGWWSSDSKLGTLGDGAG